MLALRRARPLLDQHAQASVQLSRLRRVRRRDRACPASRRLRLPRGGRAAGGPRRRVLAGPRSASPPTLRPRRCATDRSPNATPRPCFCSARWRPSARKPRPSAASSSARRDMGRSRADRRERRRSLSRQARDHPRRRSRSRRAALASSLPLGNRNGAVPRRPVHQRDHRRAARHLAPADHRREAEGARAERRLRDQALAGRYGRAWDRARRRRRNRARRRDADRASRNVSAPGLGGRVDLQHGGLPVLDGVEALTLLVDNDENGAGERAADQCERCWLDAGQEVTRLTPDDFGDFNDLVKP